MLDYSIEVFVKLFAGGAWENPAELLKNSFQAVDVVTVWWNPPLSMAERRPAKQSQIVFRTLFARIEVLELPPEIYQGELLNGRPSTCLASFAV